GLVLLQKCTCPSTQRMHDSLLLARATTLVSGRIAYIRRQERCRLQTRLCLSKEGKNLCEEAFDATADAAVQGLVVMRVIIVAIVDPGRHRRAGHGQQAADVRSAHVTLLEAAVYDVLHGAVPFPAAAPLRLQADVVGREHLSRLALL